MKYSILIVFLFLSSISLSQISEFRPSDKEFIEDIEKFISPLPKSQSKELISSFKSVYASKYSSDQKDKIVSFSNQLLKKKIKLKPHFLAFFNSVIGQAKPSNFNTEDFNNWSGVMDKLLKQRNKKKITDFIVFTDKLFNNHLLYSSSSISWKLSKGSYSFSYKSGAFAEFKNLDLVCRAKNDSSVIYGTSGILNVSTSAFVGNKGTVTWERVELPKNTTYAELNRYRINLKINGFNADSVKMYTPYLKKPELGKLREKVLTFNGPDRAKYPEFKSYNQEVYLTEIVPDVDYKGEFSLVGKNFKGGASGNNKASLIVKRNKEKFFSVSSKTIIINDDKLSSKNAEVIIHISPKHKIKNYLSDFKYDLKKGIVYVSKTGNNSINYPYVSDYHNVSMHFDKLTWKKGSSQIEMGSFAGSSKNTASFESINQFDSKTFNTFKLGNSNIAKTLNEYSLSFEENFKIPLNDFASYSKNSLSDLTQVLVKMSNVGLIDYDPVLKIIIVDKRLSDYVNSRTKEGDYDDIKIISNPKSKINAVLGLKSLDLVVEGIRKCDLSKKKFVRIYPSRGQFIIGKNRSINFSGVINAGRTEYFGSNVNFDYESFSLKFAKMDSMRLRVYPMQDSIKEMQVRLLSKLYNLEGEILIDGEENRSGKNKGFAHYPKLVVNNSPKIYYNQTEILDGIYDTSSFYFLVDPFEMDSLLTFSNSGVEFDGNFFSSDIFPKIETTTKLMSDYTLGFKLKKVSEQIYLKKANYDDQLTLDKNGLVGKGRLSFLTSSAYSQKITFYPDSMIGQTGQYTNKSQTLPSVPDIVADNCLVTFQPKTGVWTTKNIDSAMNIFDDGVSKYNGKITLTKEKMTGTGDFNSGRIQVTSKDFLFNQNALKASTSNFILKGVGKNDPPSLEANNMKMELDFSKREGNFKSNTGTSFIEFPINRFTATTDEFDWSMDKSFMTFKKVIDTANFQNYDKNKNLKPNFKSTLKEHEELGFFSGMSTYYIDSNLLVCKDIPYIVVADSWIIPKNGELRILKNAEIDPLYNSQILTSYVTKYHRFTNAEISILSGKNYLANGEYIVSSDPTINSKVFFSNIEPDENGITKADGIIEEDSNFFLSPQFKYYGSISIKGNEIGASYDGQTKILTNCEELALDWIQFNSVVDTSKIIIPLGEGFMDKVSGPTVSNDGEVSFYTAFLADKKYDSDKAITPSDGFLSYNVEKGLFEIGAKAKLLDNKAKGNYISFDDETCSFNSIGDLNLTAGMDQFKVSIVGTMEYNKLKDTVISMNGSMKLDFPFNKSALNQMFNEIRGTQVQELIKIQNTNYELFLNQMLSKEAGSKANKEISTIGKLSNVPKELSSAITLFDLKFYWDNNTQSFLSQGSANIASVGNNQVYRRCKVLVQVQKRRTGDRVGVMIQYKPNGYYVFEYRNGELVTFSTDKKYNEIIELTPDKDKVIKGGKGEEDFYFDLSSRAKPILFLREFESEAEGFDDDDDEDDAEDEEEDDFDDDDDDDEDDEDDFDDDDEED